MSDLHLEFSQGDMHVPILPNDSTRVICNPRVYNTASGRDLNKNFNPKLLVEV